jgi:hypothetical protein
MIYEDRLTPPNNWPPLVRYPSYYPNRVSVCFSDFKLTNHLRNILTDFFHRHITKGEKI